MTVESPGRDIVAIQVLRGVAASMVMFVHLDTQLARLHYPVLGSGWLAAGVDIFFVISGFIMWTSVERRSGMSARTFLKHRIIRIVPLYWTVTTLVVLIGLLAPQLLRTTVLQPWHVLASYLFLPARHPAKNVFWPVVVAGWSLNYEMLFYVVFASAMALVPQGRALRFYVITIILVIILVAAAATSPWIDVMNFYANPVLLEFIAGMLLGMICSARLIRPSPLWSVISAIGFCLIWAATRFSGGFSMMLLAATMVVAGAVFLPPLKHNALSALGDASYSLYLTHAISLAAVGLLWGRLFRPLGAIPFMLFSVAFAIGIAFLVYRKFEVPVTAALKRMSANAGATVAASRPTPLPIEHQ